MTDSDNDKIVPTNDNSIVSSLALQPDTTWGGIIQSIVDALDKEELPDDVVRAAELLVSGYPISEVAKLVGSSQYVVRSWLVKYPALAKIMAEQKKLISLYRMAKLEQQFSTAVDKSNEILSLSLDGRAEDGSRQVDPKILTVVAAQARYIIGLFAGQKSDVTVVHEFGNSVLNANESALNYLAGKLAEAKTGNEPIEAVFRVIDNKVDAQGPILMADGSPKFGKIGVLEMTDKGILCHICGGSYKSFAKHILYKHEFQVANYELAFLLPEGTIRKMEGGEHEPDTEN